MNPDISSRGFGLVCRPEGTIERFVRDDLALAERYTGHSFKDLLDHSSRAKAQAFLDAVRIEGAAFDWELDLGFPDPPQTLHFVGGSTGDALLICGIESREAVSQYLKDLTRITNEQGALVRGTVKQMLAARSQQLSEGSLYDEMTRLNNELVNTQRQLHKQTAALARINDEKNLAIGVVAHDLRNPINVLHMYSHYLSISVGERLTEEERDILQTMQQTSTSMSRLVNDVLDVSAIEAGRLRLTCAPVQLTGFIQSIVKRLTPIARKSAVALSFEATECVEATVEADAGKLEQVLNNLIDNAVKFTPPNEKVSVNLACDAEYAAITVSDGGPGIDRESLKKLFRPFSIGEGTSKHGASGTGLGLSIAKRIVEGHGGKIEVESAIGSGTCFRVLLPTRGSAPSRNAR